MQQEGGKNEDEKENMARAVCSSLSVYPDASCKSFFHSRRTSETAPGR